MKVFKYTCGDYEKYGVAEDESDAYERRAEVDPTFHYLPVTIEELRIEGYEIAVNPSVPEDREALKEWLTKRDVPFTPQLGTDKLKELALQSIK